MSDVKCILSSAKLLSVDNRLELIDALWETVPPDALPPLSDEGRAEIQRRSAELDAGKVTTIPWEQVADSHTISLTRRCTEAANIVRA